VAVVESNECYEFIKPEELLKRYPNLCGRALLYRLLAANKFPAVIKMGKMYRISVRALERAFNEGWSPSKES
jgi:hypothetical protein